MRSRTGPWPRAPFRPFRPCRGRPSPGARREPARCARSRGVGEGRASCLPARRRSRRASARRSANSSGREGWSRRERREGGTQRSPEARGGSRREARHIAGSVGARYSPGATSFLQVVPVPLLPPDDSRRCFESPGIRFFDCRDAVVDQRRGRTRIRFWRGRRLVVVTTVTLLCVMCTTRGDDAGHVAILIPLTRRARVHHTRRGRIAHALRNADIGKGEAPR